MLNLWSALPVNATLSVQVIRHPTASPASVLSGYSTDGIDLTKYTESASHGPNEANVRLSWHMELYAPGQQPQADEVLELRMNGKAVWIGIIQGVSDYGESRGSRRMTVTARSRDASPLWRQVKTKTRRYSLATDTITIVREILSFLRLTNEEIVIPESLGTYTVHTSTQMADMTPWEMLTVLVQPTGYEPYVDALGRFRLIDRTTSRAPTHTLTVDRLVSVTASNLRSPTTKVKVKWVDPVLTKTSNSEQVLATATITAGFFQLEQTQDVYFSNDRLQRADNTRLVIKQSCNSGLVAVATEEYQQILPMYGKLTLTTSAWVPALAAASLVVMVTSGSIPDAWAGVGGGPTIPIGRVVHAAAEGVIMLIMMSVGTGVYEIWGTPYDFVHATNTTEAYNSGSPEWAELVQEISNDFVMNEGQAQAMASRELIYESLSASSHSITVVDDPSIENGDILKLPDGSHFYVTGYRRDALARGESHVLSVDGFRV